MTPAIVVRTVLLVAAFAVLVLGASANKAIANNPVGCVDDQCTGGNTKCAKLPNGSICYTIP